MDWLFGFAFVPLLMCGLMCLGGMALAMFGRRRADDGRHRDVPAITPDRDEPTRVRHP